MISAQAALERLRDGNRRFVVGNPERHDAAVQARREELTAGQAPFAVVLGCADSRVPVEILFDQGLGDLFVVRVAGNVATPAEMGSIEFAAERLGVPLVVVLGHSSCGAVAATLAELENPTADLSPNLGAIVELIAPAISALREVGAESDRDVLMQQAVRANVMATVNRLRRESAVMSRLIRDDGLLVVGAEYALATGVVDFFDGLPPSGP